VTTQKLELEFDDVKIGCAQLGFMRRSEDVFTGRNGYDSDDEDEAYERFLLAKGVKARVLDGYVFLDDTTV